MALVWLLRLAPQGYEKRGIARLRHAFRCQKETYSRERRCFYALLQILLYLEFLVWEQTALCVLFFHQNHVWNGVTLTTRASGVIRGCGAVVKRPVRKHTRLV